jgi:hypothetical protein
VSGRACLWPFITLMWCLGLSAGAFAQEATGSTWIVQATRPMGRTVSDLYVTAHDPSQIRDTDPVLFVSAESVVLLRFDLSRLPTNAEIFNATLELWAEGRSAPAALEVLVYPLGRPRGEETDWLMATMKQLREEGAAPDEMFSRQTLDGVSHWYVWDVTNIVRRQLQFTPREAALVVAAEGEGVEYYLASSEWQSVHQRPRLTVRYRLSQAKVEQEDVLSKRSIALISRPAMAEMSEPTPASPLSDMPKVVVATPDPTFIPAGLASSAEVVSSEPSALTLTPVPISAPIGMPSPPSRVQARIEALWSSSPQQVNATVYLFSEMSLMPPPCAWEPTVRLWGAAGSMPARPLAVGKKRMTEERGVRFPVWDFSGVDISTLGQRGEPIHFFATVDGVITAHNVVSIGRDVRTLNAAEPIPVGLVQEMPSRVDAWISILWPHGGMPVQQAERANLTAILFAAGTRWALPAASFQPGVRLHWAINDAVDATGGQGILGSPREISRGGIRYLVWDFNNLDIRMARNPDNRMYFWLSVDGMEAYSTVWVHSVDGRPILPMADLPASSCP